MGDHIQQLKTIREEAIARLRRTSDYKLAKKLGLLIIELGESVDDKLEFDPDEERKSAIASSSASKVETVKPVTNAGSEDTPGNVAKDAPLPMPERAQPRIVPVRPGANTAKAEADGPLTSEEVMDELVAEIESDATLLKAVSNVPDATGGPALMQPAATSNGKATSM